MNDNLFTNKTTFKSFAVSSFTVKSTPFDLYNNLEFMAQLILHLINCWLIWTINFFSTLSSFVHHFEVFAWEKDQNWTCYHVFLKLLRSIVSSANWILSRKPQLLAAKTKSFWGIPTTLKGAKNLSLAF